MYVFSAKGNAVKVIVQDIHNTIILVLQVLRKSIKQTWHYKYILTMCTYKFTNLHAFIKYNMDYHMKHLLFCPPDVELYLFNRGMDGARWQQSFAYAIEPLVFPWFKCFSDLKIQLRHLSKKTYKTINSLCVNRNICVYMYATPYSKLCHILEFKRGNSKLGMVNKENSFVFGYITGPKFIFL